MSDDVQHPTPDEAKNTHGLAEPDDTESHRFRGAFTPTDEESLPGPDEAKRRPFSADDTDDVEGHKKHIR